MYLRALYTRDDYIDNTLLSESVGEVRGETMRLHGDCSQPDLPHGSKQSNMWTIDPP
jgi:hypothetical protein